MRKNIILFVFLIIGAVACGKDKKKKSPYFPKTAGDMVFEAEKRVKLHNCEFLDYGHTHFNSWGSWNFDLACGELERRTYAELQDLVIALKDFMFTVHLYMGLTSSSQIRFEKELWGEEGKKLKKYKKKTRYISRMFS